MPYWKNHKSLRMTLILLFFLVGLGLVIGGWTIVGKMSGLLLMLLGLGLLLSALMLYNKAFQEPNQPKKKNS